jgi:hypothetical protein
MPAIEKAQTTIVEKPDQTERSGLDALPANPRQWLMTINCVPCEYTNGYFVPTSKDTLSGLGGKSAAHPINNLRRAFEEGDENGSRKDLSDTIAKKSIGGMVLLLDDIDTKTNWYLPPNFDLNLVDQYIKVFGENIKQSLGAQFKDVFQIPLITASLSQLLACYNLQDAYSFFHKKACLQVEALWKKKKDAMIFDSQQHNARKLLVDSYVKRYKHHRDQGYTNAKLQKGETHQDMIHRSANNIGGYAAQGWFVQQLGSTYIPLFSRESKLMESLGAKLSIIRGFESND